MSEQSDLLRAKSDLTALFDSNYVLNKKLRSAGAALQAADGRFKALATENARLKTQLAMDVRRKKTWVLRPVHASLGLECEYRRRIHALVEEMNKSVCYWVAASYRGNQPEVSELEAPPLALDALPANVLRRTVRRLARRWQKRFNEASSALAEWFAINSRRRSRDGLQRILRQGGWAVDIQMTQAQRDILQSVIHENVSLIRSIPQQYFTQIEGMVMRSVQTGRDLGQLNKDLVREFGVTKRRAALIARDQNNKASASLTRVQHLELGIVKAIWVHSHAGKTFRRTHIANDGEEYDIREGWFDPDPKVRRRIHPGELINCKCFPRPVIPGFS